MSANARYFTPAIMLMLSLILRGGPAVSDTMTNEPFSPVRSQVSTAEQREFHWVVRSIGIQTMVVLTEKYHGGFGYGGRLTTRFFDDYSTLISEIGFWGATRDTTDIAVLGLQETMTYMLNKSDTMRGFAGLCLGYFYIYQTDTGYHDGYITSREHKFNSFDIFFTYGIEYTLSEERSLLLQIKYGVTEFSDELQIIAGLNFDPHRLRREP